MRSDSPVRSAATAVILAVLCLLVIVPLLWSLSLAFRSNEEIVRMTGVSLRSFVPERFTLGNFDRLFKAVRMPRVFAVTLFVCLSVTFLSLLVNSAAAYAFSRISFRGKSILFAIVIATMILPIEILIVPLYRTVKDLGMMNRLASLILPFSATGFGIFFMRQFMAGIPWELDEAAEIDGCNRFTMFSMIMIPLCRTALVTLGLIVFLQQWDNFLIPVTFISNKNLMLLQVAIADIYSHMFFTDTALLFAGIFVSAVPVIVIFVFLQRYYVAGISSVGIKG
jgi:multiple sugar transport system permease protein